MTENVKELASPGQLSLIEKLAEETNTELKDLDRLTKDGARRLIIKLKIANGTINELATDAQKQLILSLAEQKGVTLTTDINKIKKESAKKLINKLKTMTAPAVPVEAETESA